MKLLNAKIKKIKSSKGFTLIELLVVIGIIGILAAALIATLDPVEQLNKGADATLKDISNTYVQAYNAYYASHGVVTANCNALTTVDIGSAASQNCITDLKNDGELRSTFTNSSAVTATGVKAIKVTTTVSSIVTCFLPSSKAVEQDAGTKYQSNGAVGGTCLNSGTSTATGCYWCAQ